MSLARPSVHSGVPLTHHEFGHLLKSGVTEAHFSSDKYKEFVKAVNLRFAMIDVTKSHKLSKGKKAEDALTICNELKLITSAQETFDLWSAVISKAMNGEFMDPSTLRKFNDRGEWRLENGALSREFFCWLRNLSENDLRRLASHILNCPDPKRDYPYPKVTIKSTNSLLPSCYTAKEWLERKKRKQLVKMELHLLKHDLGLFNAVGEIDMEKWRVFKTEYNVTRATMNVLLEQPGDEYFAAAKQMRNRNKKAANLSPYAAEFFKVFLSKKKGFEKAASSGHYRPYNIVSNFYAAWPRNSWTDWRSQDLALGVIDFRTLPNVHVKEQSSMSAPYFIDFMTSLKRRREPSFEEPPAWLFICADKVEELKVVNFIETDSVLKEYKVDFANYVPAIHERLGDVKLSNSKAKAKVILIFLQKKH